jgi:hypothetical protein
MGVIVYEVNLFVDAAIGGEYRQWLATHVAQILQLPGFIDARILEVLESDVEPRAQCEEVALCVQYTLRDRAALETYLGEHAPRMRGDGEARFGGRFRARRRVLGEAG